MSYQALYRKYRPLDFSDVVGQDVVVQTLKNALKNSKTSHAYMFSGPRGTGKTTIAKILAKTINCLEPHDGISCGKCKNCLSILNNECTDIIEIDAASNNGVDEIREIRNKINLVPAELKYKVYIIDEVHMLSIGAFNALLKTLEEPPEHIIFILATTDPHKVPITIVSRCQCFEFKRISVPNIIERLKQVCEIEHIDIQESVLEKIAKISDGGMRDSLGMLDKLSSYCSEGKITLAEFQKINGLVDKDYQEKFISIIYKKDILNIINSIEELYVSGKDFIVFAQDLIELLREKMIAYYVESKEEYPISFIIQFIEQLNKFLVNGKSVGNIQILFETSLLEFVGDFQNQSSVQKIVANEAKPVENIKIHKEVPVEKEIIVEKTIEEDKKEVVDNTEKRLQDENNDFIAHYRDFSSIVVNNTFATAQKELLNHVKDRFSLLNDFVLDKSYGAAACYLLDSQIRAVGNGYMILTCNYESVLERGIKLLHTIEELTKKLVDSTYRIAILTDDEWNRERENFVNTKKSGGQYVLKDLTDDFNIVTSDNNNLNDNDIVNQAIAIFGSDIVSVE